MGQQYHRNDSKVQTPHGDAWGNYGVVMNLGHGKPVINDEYSYIAAAYGVPERMAFTPTVHRNAMWGVVTAGGFGSSGDGRVFTDGGKPWAPYNTGEWADAPHYDDIKHMVDFFTTKGIEYWKMTSRNDLKAASRTRDYVLAEPGRQYVLYTAVGGSSVQLDLGSASAATALNVWKYDPVNGAMTRLAPTTGGAVRTFDLSGTNAGGADDWVLLVTTLPVP